MADKTRSLPTRSKLESSFQSSTTVNSSTPLTRADTPDSDTTNHDYASPLELQRDIAELKKRSESTLNGGSGHQKKSCAIYEPAELKPKKLSGDENDVRFVHRHERLFRILFFILFTIVLLSICLSVLSLLGFRLGKTDTKCNCGSSSSVSVFSASTKKNESESKPVSVNIFEERLKAIEENVIPKLLQTIVELKNQLDVTSNRTVVGPVGPPGSNGPEGPKGDQGPPGQSNMKNCRDRTNAVTSQLRAPYERIFATTDHIQATTGYVMLGATCQAFGAAEYTLFTREKNGTTLYYCTCAGKAATSALGPNPMNEELECRIRWWECPLT